jgi:WD40 repeat protein
MRVKSKQAYFMNVSETTIRLRNSVADAADTQRTRGHVFRAARPHAGRVAILGFGLLLIGVAAVLLLTAMQWPARGRVLVQRGAVTSVAYAPAGDLLATGSGDTAVRLWQPQTGALVATLRGHGDWVFDVAFAPDGRTVASASWDRTARLWSAHDGALLHTLRHANLVWDVTFAPDGQTIATATQDGVVNLWRVADGTLVRAWQAHARAAHAVAFTPDGQRLVSGGEDGMVKIWRVRDGALLETFHTGSRVLDVAVSPDASMLAAASWDGTVRLWRVRDGALLETLRGHTGRVFSVSFAPDGQRLLSTGDNGLARLWRVQDGALLATMSARQRELAQCSLAQGWRIIQRCHVEPSANLLLYTAAFSPDGQHIAVADGTTLRIDPPRSPFDPMLAQGVLLLAGGMCALLGAALLVWALRRQLPQ